MDMYALYITFSTVLDSSGTMQCLLQRAPYNRLLNRLCSITTKYIIQFFILIGFCESRWWSIVVSVLTDAGSF